MAAFPHKEKSLSGSNKKDRYSFYLSRPEEGSLEEDISTLSAYLSSLENNATVSPENQIETPLQDLSASTLLCPQESADITPFLNLDGGSLQDISISTLSCTPPKDEISTSSTTEEELLQENSISISKNKVQVTNKNYFLPAHCNISDEAIISLCKLVAENLRGSKSTSAIPYTTEVEKELETVLTPFACVNYSAENTPVGVEFYFPQLSFVNNKPRFHTEPIYYSITDINLSDAKKRMLQYIAVYTLPELTKIINKKAELENRDIPLGSHVFIPIDMSSWSATFSLYFFAQKSIFSGAMLLSDYVCVHCISRAGWSHVFPTKVIDMSSSHFVHRKLVELGQGIISKSSLIALLCDPNYLQQKEKLPFAIYTLSRGSHYRDLIKILDYGFFLLGLYHSSIGKKSLHMNLLKEHAVFKSDTEINSTFFSNLMHLLNIRIKKVIRFDSVQNLLSPEKRKSSSFKLNQSLEDEEIYTIIKGFFLAIPLWRCLFLAYILQDQYFNFEETANELLLIEASLLSAKQPNDNREFSTFSNKLNTPRSINSSLFYFFANNVQTHTERSIAAWKEKHITGPLVLTGGPLVMEALSPDDPVFKNGFSFDSLSFTERSSSMERLPSDEHSATERSSSMEKLPSDEHSATKKPPVPSITKRRLFN